MINDGVFILLKNRNDKEKIFINNDYKKYTDITATKICKRRIFVL